MKDKFREIIKFYLKDPVFIEVFNLVKINSEGKVYLMGGFLYKNIANYLYGEKKVYNYDIDFFVDKRNNEILPVKGWKIEKNSYGHENYIRENNRMSFTEIGKSIRVSKIKPETVESFIRETPLNIQSIAYDLEGDKIIGEEGINAIINKKICINNLGQASFYAERKGKTLEQIIEEKAREVGFTAVHQ